MPDEKRGFNGSEIGSQVTYELLKEDLDIRLEPVGIKDFNPYEFNFNHIKYNFKILSHYISKAFLLRKQVKKSKFDIFYFVAASSTKGHFRDILTVLLVRPYVSQIIVHNRNGNFNEIYSRLWHRSLTKWFIKSVDKFIFLSEGLKKSTDRFIETSKKFVVLNPIDANVVCTPSEVEYKIQLRQSRKTLRILYLSNMILTKGYFDLAQAALILKNAGFNNFTLDFIGRWNNTSDKQRFSKFIGANDLSANIKVHGKITSRVAAKQRLLEADIFVLPTYYPQEAQPRSIIEALNAGTPVIVTNHASIPEMVENEVDSLIVNKQSPTEIADAIIRLNNYTIWKQMAQNCRTNYEEKFSHQAISGNLLSVFS